MDASRLIRERVLSMQPYRVQESNDAIALHRNESPVELPDAVRGEILDALRGLSWRRYPSVDQANLRSQARDLLELDPSHDVLFGNGSNELIAAILQAAVDPGEAVAIPQPTFSVYERLTRLFHGCPKPVPPTMDLRLDVARLADDARASHARVIFVCRPNNPTGECVALSDIEALAEFVEGLVVIDEAYVDFADDSAWEVAERHENVILLRTLSKALRCAGLRVGYAFGHVEVMGQIAKTLLPYNMSVCASAAAVIVLKERNSWLSALEETKQERARVASAITELEGSRILPSSANFLCLLTPFAGDDLTSRLAEFGILVRNLSGYPGLSNAVRITIGAKEESDALIQALRRIWKERP